MPRKRRKGEPTHFSAVAEGVISAGRLRRLRPYFMVVRKWEEAVGSDLAQRAQPSGLWKGVLNVEVSENAWMFQLQQMREHLLARLRCVLGDEVEIEDLRIVPSRGATHDAERHSSKTEERGGKLDRKTAERLLDIPEISGKDDLKEALRRLMTGE